MSVSCRLPVVIVFGPTAVGKTDLLFSLFSGRGEVISADSMQVYRGMDVGTAKPRADELAALPHHLLDLRNPDEQFTVGDFVRHTDDAIKLILCRGRIPVISGGTAYYLKTFLYGLADAPPSDPGIREELKAELLHLGSAVLHERLVEIDPIAAQRISPNDGYRIIRAHEVFRLTGKPLSAYGVPESRREDIDPLLIGLDRDRSELYARINRRVDVMFERGLVEEVRTLRRNGYGENDPGMHAIGYREFALMEKAGCLTLREVKDLIRMNSRRYAKRQLTFMRSLPGVLWFNPASRVSITETITSFCRSRSLPW